ncbi:MAG: DNA-deoxyinosine glycosylase [Novosphingobium sp.]
MHKLQKTGLAPIAPRGARVLILGSLPGDASLTASRYYAHPRNQFWQLVGNVIHRELVSLAYDDRLDCLAMSSIALWDMVAVGRRRGSLDAALFVDELADIAGLISRLPDITAVAFNGIKAAKLGAGVAPLCTVPRLTLPSSSPANTMPVAAKQAVWNSLAKYLPPRHAHGS